MKSYTDLEQSKILSKILSLESADMYYFTIIRDYPYSQGKIKTIAKIMDGSFSSDYDTPCWSLAALLDNIPQVKLDSIIQSNEKLWRCLSYFKSEWNESIWCNNPVDACYEMIIKLNEQKLL